MPRHFDKNAASKARLQIGPGGLMFFVVSGLILAIGIYAQANLLFWAFGLMVGALVVSIILSWMMMRDVTVQRVLPSHGVAGELLAIRYQLVNRKRWMPAFGVVISEAWGKGTNGWRKTGPIAKRPQQLKGQPHGWVMHLGPNQTVQAESPCWPLRRGHLQFERIVVHTSFPFGIVRRVLEFEQPGQTLVFPHLYRINRRVLFSLAEADPQGRKKLERSGGHEEFFGLREYRAGDSLKMIDWRRSAKTGKLVSREMTQPSPPKIMLALDVRKPAAAETPPPARGLFRSRPRKPQDDTDMRVERAVSLAASLVCDAYMHGYQIGMVVIGASCVPFPVHHSLPHRTKILEALSQLEVGAPVEDNLTIPVIPSVVITMGQEDASGFAGPHTMVMSAADMESYVLEFEQGSMEVLASRVRPDSRRQELAQGVATWD